MKPFLKWAGGKRRLVPQIRKLIPKTFARYHEPFLGGGALFFDMLPHNAFLSDSNAKLIAAYTGVRNNVNLVIDALKLFKNTSECYYKTREKNFNEGPLSQRAADFIYCNRLGFNGLYRENRKGEFNVPFGNYANPRICDEEGLRDASVALRGTNLLPLSFLDSSKFVEANDVWYADPPFVPIHEDGSFTAYTSKGFGIKDHIKLRDLALELRGRGAHVILSNSSAPLVYDLYEKHFKILEVKMPRSINSDGNSRDEVTELLIY